jgi:hypothetical protein
MFRTFFFALVALAASTGLASAACAGADPAIASATVKGVAPDGNMNRYTIDITVTNSGGATQPTNTLQFVDIYQGTVKLDAKGVPPLKPGQSYTVSYDSLRSHDAGQGTTTLRFALDVQQPADQNCSTANDASSVTF